MNLNTNLWPNQAMAAPMRMPAPVPCIDTAGGAAGTPRWGGKTVLAGH